MIYLFNDVKELTGTVRNNHILNLLYEREKNGIYSVSAEIPVTYNDQGTTYNYNKKIQKSDFLGHYDREGRFQLHKIAAVDIENGSIFVKGIHIFFDEAKAGAIIQDRRFVDREIIDGARVAFESIGWSVADFDVSVGKTYNFYNVTPLEARQILVETFGFEFDYWLDFDGKKVTNRHVAVKEKIGEKTSKRYTYGHNVLNIRAEQDYSEIYTAVIGRGKGEEIEETGGYGRRIEYTDVVWSKPSKPLNKPAGTRVLEDTNATQLFGYKENGVVKPRIKVEVFSDIESPTELIQASYEWLMDNNVPKAVFSLKAADGDGLNLGDEVYVIYRDIDLIKSARVEKVTDDLVSGNRDVEFGDTAYFDTDRRLSGLRSDLKRYSGETGDRIYRLKMEFNRRFDEEVSSWVAEYEQALIDVHAEIEADRENMTNLIEGTRNDLTNAINTEVTQAKDYAEQQAQAKADSVQTNLDSFSDRHQQLYDEVTGNVLDIDTFIGDKSETLKQQFDRVHTDFSTLQTDLEGVESDLTATKTDLQQQLDEARAELDGLEVGTRNLIPDSHFYNGSNNLWSPVYGTHVVEEHILKKTYTRGVTSARIERPFRDLEVGQTYTLTMYMKTDVDISWRLFLASELIKSSDSTASEEYKIYSVTFKVTSEEEVCIRGYQASAKVGSYTHMDWFTLVKGNMPTTDWIPAPEDTEQKITTLNQQIEFIDGQLSAKLEQTDIEPINNKITEYGNSLTANAQSIQSLINKTELHDGDITQWSNETKANAESISQTLTRVEETEAGISQAQTDIQTNADGIAGVIRDVEAIDGNLSSLTTEFNVEAGKIETLISKTDGHDTQLTDFSIDVDGIKTTVSKVEDDMITGFSEFTQSLDGFSQSVGQMEHDLDYGLSTINQKYDSISSRVANIKLNTRNLIRGTDFEDPEMFYLYGNSTVRNIEGQKYVRLSYQEGLNTASVMFMEYTHLKANEDYFLVVDHRSYGTDEFDYLQLQLEDGSYTRIEDADSGEEGFTNIPATGTDWHQSVIRIRLTEPLSGRLRIGTRFDRGTTSTSFIDVRNLYLTNTLNREWVPHPRDGQNIDSLVERVSDIEQTAEEIRLSVSDSTGLASVLSISSTAMDIISENLNLTGNMNVRGQIESISVSAVRGDIAYLKTNILTSNSIDSDMIQSEVISSVHINVTNALVERIIARNVFANEVNALSIEAVHADLSSVSSRIMETNILKADWIQGGNALLDKVFATSAMFNRMMAKSGFVTALNTVTIDTDQITIRRPDGYQIVNNGVPNWDFSYADTQPRFFSSGSSITGTYYTTSNDVYTTVDATYFQHNTRYVNIRGYAYMYRSTTNPVYGGNVRLSTFGESNSVSNITYIPPTENSQGSPMFINLTLDLGKPDGRLRQIYTQTKVSNSDGYDEIRFRRLLLRFHG